MPEVISCSKCHKKIRVKDFPDQMKKLRKHYSEVHPVTFRKSIKKGVETRRRNRATK